MTQFKYGDKVRCINVERSVVVPNTGNITVLTKGKIYTVLTNKSDSAQFTCITNDDGNTAEFLTSRFELVVETPRDPSIDPQVGDIWDQDAPQGNRHAHVLAIVGPVLFLSHSWYKECSRINRCEHLARTLTLSQWLEQGFKPRIEPKQPTELVLTLVDVAAKFNVPVETLRIKD